MKNETVRSNVPKMSIHVGKGTTHIEPRDVAAVHYHDELEFLPVYEGVFCCTVDGKDYLAKKGDIIFINSGVPHSTKCIEPSRSGLLQFKESDFQTEESNGIIKYSVRLQGLSEAPVKVLRSEYLFSVIDGILDEASRKEPAYEYYIRSGIYEVLGHLYREKLLSSADRLYNSRDVVKILPVLSFINENYAENITLVRASALLSFDQSYFCRIFKSAIGATFTEYLNFVRICKAEKLLANTRDSILEISEAVGFSSVSYFNRIFKKYKSCSPRYYRTAKYCNI